MIGFSFPEMGLTGQLQQASQETLTGHWQIDLTASHETGNYQPWYLAVVQGRVIFSGHQLLSWGAFLENLQTFIPRLRAPQSQQVLEKFKQVMTPAQLGQLGNMLLRMEKLNLLNQDEAINAFQIKILSDLDAYLTPAGHAQFLPDDSLQDCSPIPGFELNALLLQSVKRRVEWQQLKGLLPATDSLLSLHPDTPRSSQLSDAQKQQLQRWLGPGRTLAAIADEMGKDPLDVAKTFASLIQKGFVVVGNPGATLAVQQSQIGKSPEIFIVDDSQMLLKQFQSLVTGWGYQVKICQDPLLAVDQMLQSRPEAIFLDINMPGTSGFELIKQIRRQPQLATIPLVLLTAEKSVSNQWRAQWANCKFLAKPKLAEEVATFRSELRELLRAIAPIAADVLV